MKQKIQNNLHYLLIAFIFIFTLIQQGCNENEEKQSNEDELEQFTPKDDTNWSEQEFKSVVASQNQFAFDLYSELTKTENGNIFFSPYSIFSALTITYEGAVGDTAQEMKDVLHLPETDILRPNYAHLYNLINEPNEYYELNTANALWLQIDFPFKDEYIEVVTSYYDAYVTNLDFIGDPEGSRQTINSYIAEKTHNRIKELLPENSITSATILVITNAIYFKGKWLIQFNKSATSEEDFYITPDESIKVKMMHIDEGKFNYGETDEVQLLELPYKGESLSMFIILPRGELSDIEPLTYEKLNEYKASMWGETEVSVSLPKFELKTGYTLNNQLQSLGMVSAFGDADFSGLSPEGENLFISNVYHKAFIKVDEEGTEATAATGVVINAEAEAIEFRVDHPFIFLIQHRETGTILFMGRVVNPNE